MTGMLIYLASCGVVPCVGAEGWARGCRFGGKAKSGPVGCVLVGLQTGLLVPDWHSVDWFSALRLFRLYGMAKCCLVGCVLVGL